MSQTRSKTEIDALYKELNVYADQEYVFAIFYERYINQLRDYGNGVLINMVEVHTLTMIADQPGITVNELAKQWRRTKGAVSQNVKKLSRKGLIRKERSEKDSRNVHLYVTELGQELADLHKKYDVEEVLKLRNDLLKDCTQQELDTFYKVLTLYNTKWDESKL
ncbi:MAG: MarR family transcriptional regulator [Oscillospiraceae bacterium]|nr:MarR family transcriptional regulator [Oscillospiraceae bacterium]